MPRFVASSASPRTTRRRPTSPPPQMDNFLTTVVEPQFLGAGWQATGRTPPTRASSPHRAQRDGRRPRSAPTTTACASSPWRPPRSPTCSMPIVSEAARKTVDQPRRGLVGEAIGDLANLQSETGIVAEPGQRRQRPHQHAGRPFRANIMRLEGVDPYEASTRVADLCWRRSKRPTRSPRASSNSAL